jgi:ubiquinone/menaquinone biosynthesis C-methylase UbiE
MLRAAARRGLKNLVRADAGSLPFADGSIDAAMIMESAGYFATDPVLRQINRVLRRNGCLYITAYPPQHDSDDLYKKVSLTKIAGDLRRCGFRISVQQMVVVNRNGVRPAGTEGQATLLYLAAKTRK